MAINFIKKKKEAQIPLVVCQCSEVSLIFTNIYHLCKYYILPVTSEVLVGAIYLHYSHKEEGCMV